jgi:hypothetical protein
MSSSVRWLRAEGLAAFIVLVILYAQYGSGWLLFAALFFVPDVALVGYLRGPGPGGLIYNLGHSYVGPALVAGVAVTLGQPMMLSVAVIWAAHIGFDRALGYGLKLPGGFKETHLGTIGKSPAAEREPAAAS